MKESNLQTLFKHYLEKNPPVRTEVYELKIVKGNSMPFNAVKEHQVKGLIQASEGLYHKISDSPIFAGNKTRFTKPKPFDCIYLIGAKPFIVILFYTPRRKKETYIISLDIFLEFQQFSERKSLTQEQAKLISYKIITL